MADISQENLKKEIQEILKDADLDNTSAKKVRLQLEKKLGLELDDLMDRKKEIDDLVMEIINEQTQDEEDGDEDESESEEDTPPKKRKPVVTKPKAKAKKRADSDESGSEYSPPGSDDEEEAAPSDGGGSDYEPDEPVRIGRGAKIKKKVSRRDSDDESSGEEWGGRKKGGNKGRKRAGSSDEDDSDYEKPKPKKKSTGGGGGKGNGYTAPVKLSAELADIVGGDEMPRHEVVKRMWAYIKENQLQDPKNKAFVKCDEKLSKIVPTKKFRGFGMTKYLKDHMNVE